MFKPSQLVGRSLIERGASGKIVNIAYLLSFQGGIRVPAYAASKGDVAQLTKALSNEWAPKGIQVNAIASGYVSNCVAYDELGTGKFLNVFRCALGRSKRYCDCGSLSRFTCGELHTGAILNTDGGWLAR